MPYLGMGTDSSDGTVSLQDGEVAVAWDPKRNRELYKLLTRVMTDIPDVYLDLLLQKKSFAHLATVMSDGSPQNTPVWFDYVDGKIRINSARGRVKTRTMKLGAKVALSIMDPDDPDRYVQLRGTVSRVRQDDVAAAHIDSLAHKYLGLDKNPYAKADDVRMMFEITVTSVQGMT